MKQKLIQLIKTFAPILIARWQAKQSAKRRNGR